MAGNGATGMRLKLCLLAAVSQNRHLAGSRHGLFSLLMMSIKRLRFGFYSLLFVSLLAGCSRPAGTDKLEVLRVGVLPDQHADHLALRYKDLLEYLSNELGMPYELVIPESYAMLVEEFVQKRIDLANFGAVTYLQARKKAQAAPLVMRDVDTKFTSYFLVRAQESGQSISDFRGRRFCFGDKNSTSGHLMPRHFLNQQDIVPESFFSEVRYSGSHDRTAQWVRDGIVDIGAANSLVIRNMFRTGRLDNDQVKVLWETPYYSDYVWAIQPGISKVQVDQLRNAFLALSDVNPEHSEILAAMGAASYLPAGHSDFMVLERILEENNQAVNASF